MKFGCTAAKKSAQLGLSSGAIFILIAFLSGLCFNMPDYACEMLKDGQRAELCARPLIASARPRGNRTLALEGGAKRIVVVVPQSVNDEALQFDGVAK